MDVYSEEQQIESIKKWWQKNGNSVLIGIALSIAAVLGWQTWKQNQQTDREAAAALYSQLLDAAELSRQARIDADQEKLKEQKTTLLHLGEQVKEEFSGTEYSVLSALMLAREHVFSGELDAAQKELEWANSQSQAQSLKLVINLRLARVLAAKEQYDAALKQLDAVTPGVQASAYEEVRGDIYLAQGDKDKARQAYQKALDQTSEEQAGNQRQILQMKYDNLLVADS